MKQSHNFVPKGYPCTSCGLTLMSMEQIFNCGMVSEAGLLMIMGWTFCHMDCHMTNLKMKKKCLFYIIIWSHCHVDCHMEATILMGRSVNCS